MPDLFINLHKSSVSLPGPRSRALAANARISNYPHGKYQFAFLAYHMLPMSFICVNIWQIEQTEPGDFARVLSRSHRVGVTTDRTRYVVGWMVAHQERAALAAATPAGE